MQPTVMNVLCVCDHEFSPHKDYFILKIDTIECATYSMSTYKPRVRSVYHNRLEFLLSKSH